MAATLESPGPEDGHLLPNLLHFCRLLRTLGLSVTLEREALLLQALELVELGSRRQVKDAARAVLVESRGQRAIFEAAFDAFFRGDVHLRGPKLSLGEIRTRSQRVQKRVVQTLFRSDGEDREAGSETPDPVIDRRGTASAREVLARKDFAELTPDEERQVRALMQEAPLRLPPRRTRRWQKAVHGGRLDLRRTLRRSLRTAGEALVLERQARRRKPRPLVILCDISGSMESYSRILLQFAYVAAGWGGRREAFVFGTRLTRVTRQLEARSVDQALREATAAVADWGGGTRIGEALRRFNREWGRRILGRGAVVLLVSDGWDRGEPELLAQEMARLRRSAKRVIWLNPLLGTPGYEPLTRGMVAALPFVDDFLAVHNLHSLEQLARYLEKA
jgi:uncharacterized protein with von Willebrand factor type A (vWA) domain